MANISYRPLVPGMGQAVAERTILRKDSEGNWETWGDVAHRVALGNSMLRPGKGQKEDIDLILKTCATIKGLTLCPLGDAFAMPIEAMVAKFRSEFEVLIKG